MPSHCLLNQSISVRTTGDLVVFHTFMPFVPRLSLFPVATIGGTILKQISNILVESGLVVLGNQEIIARKPMDLRT